jgi:hypothetical protein
MAQTARIESIENSLILQRKERQILDSCANH